LPFLAFYPGTEPVCNFTVTTDFYFPATCKMQANAQLGKQRSNIDKFPLEILCAALQPALGVNLPQHFAWA
jgi:hypothetical protein